MRSLVRLLVILACCAAPLAAQSDDVRSPTRGLAITPYVAASRLTWTADLMADRTDAATGIGALLTWGLTDQWTLWGDAQSLKPSGGTYTLAHLGAGVRLTLLENTSAIRPHLEFGYLQRLESGSAGFGLTGTVGDAFALGGGVLWFPTPRLAVDLAYRGATGPMDQLALATSTLRLGVVWRLGSRE